MRAIVDILEERISSVMTVISGQSGCAAIVRPATDPKFGDYQVNGVMSLAKRLKTNPRKLAEEIVKNIDLSDICESPEVAGPGFINLQLKPEFIAGGLLEINRNIDSLAIEKTSEPKTIVVDFSSPNIAKQMHVGHLRSTIIGDSICRMLESLGHKVIRQNHIGDWGLQMGNVIKACRDFGLDVSSNEWAEEYLKQDELKTIKKFCENISRSNGDKYNQFVDLFRKRGEEAKAAHLTLLEEGYKRTTEQAKQNSKIADEIKNWTRDLQKGDSVAHMFWESAREITLEACQVLYSRLSVLLNDKDVRGESAYNDDLPKVVEELKSKGLAVESDGAVCVFPKGFKNKEGERLPFIIQKSDGAYLYATTDLAALRYRVTGIKYDEKIFKADKIIYVTDARQIKHFQMLFEVANETEWNRRDSKEVELVHVTFGSILGDDGTPLKTRSGENVKLKELLDEAVKRAKDLVDKKSPEYSEDVRNGIAKAVGIGAVKYADYSNNRTSDYVFSFDKMLAMDGNTAPYMQYAYARICSIMDKGKKERGLDAKKVISDITTLNLTELEEIDLAKYLIRYGETIKAAAADYRPNYLTSYLYELAQKFSVFYTNCPVLGAEPDKRPTRLLLCELTARTIRHGLSELLGIEVVEQM